MHHNIASILEPRQRFLEYFTQEDADRAFGPSKSESQPSEHKAFESILGYLWYNVVKPCLSCLAKVEAVGPNKLYESCF